MGAVTYFVTYKGRESAGSLTSARTGPPSSSRSRSHRPHSDHGHDHASAGPRCARDGCEGDEDVRSATTPTSWCPLTSGSPRRGPDVRRTTRPIEGTSISTVWPTASSPRPPQAAGPSGLPGVDAYSGGDGQVVVVCGRKNTGIYTIL